jgi:hypothetical protein
MFGNYFNQPVNNLPSTITHLQFGWKFNQPVNNLPSSITHLKFKYDFNQQIDNLPNSLISLSLRGDFNQQINHLPDSLKFLNICSDFDQSVNHLPKNLECLGFDSVIPMNDIPSHISTIKIIFYPGEQDNGYIDNLPSTIKKIIVNDITKIHYITKIPFGCEIVEEKIDNELIH